MATALVASRARSDIDVLSRADLGMADFVDEATRAVERAVPFDAGCFALLDPATALVTGTYKLGALRGHNEHDVAWAQVEYGQEDPTALLRMALSGSSALGVHDLFAGQVERSARMAHLIVPVFAFGDEARAVFADRDGVWYVLSAAPLGGTPERAGDVVVSLEEARPPEVVGLVAAAFGLTARERDVLALVLSGADTREIAASLHLSPYTVQDHLKSVFEKAEVTSRRELVARVFFDQYAPRLAGQVHRA